MLSAGGSARESQSDFLEALERSGSDEAAPIPASITAALLRGMAALLRRLASHRWAFTAFALPLCCRAGGAAAALAIASNDAEASLVLDALVALAPVVVESAALDEKAGVSEAGLQAALLRLLAASASRFPKGAADGRAAPLRRLLRASGLGGWGALEAAAAGRAVAPRGAHAPFEHEDGHIRATYAPLRHGGADSDSDDGAGNIISPDAAAAEAAAGAAGGAFARAQHTRPAAPPPHRDSRHAAAAAAADADSDSDSDADGSDSGDEREKADDAAAVRAGAALLAHAWVTSPLPDDPPRGVGAVSFSTAAPFAAQLLTDSDRPELGAEMCAASALGADVSTLTPSAAAALAPGSSPPFIELSAGVSAVLGALGSAVCRADLPPPVREACFAALCCVLSKLPPDEVPPALSSLVWACSDVAVVSLLFIRARVAAAAASASAALGRPMAASLPPSLAKLSCAWLADALACASLDPDWLPSASDAAISALSVLRWLLGRDKEVGRDACGFAGGDGARFLRASLLLPLRHAASAALGGDEAGGESDGGGDGSGAMALRALLHVVEQTLHMSSSAAAAVAAAGAAPRGARGGGDVTGGRA